MSQISTHQITTLYDRHHIWQQAICDTYFQLQVDFLNSNNFHGVLRTWEMGDLTLSYLNSSPAQYHRLPEHLQHLSNEEAFLLTLPINSAVSFTQKNREIECCPSHFLLEMSHEPYQFSYSHPTRLWVLKIPHRVLSCHLYQPERYVAHIWQAQKGMGRLLLDYINACAQQLDTNDNTLDTDLMSQHIIGLFVHIVGQQDTLLDNITTQLRQQHLAKIREYARNHLSSSDLTPQSVADACQISVRYLHHLFEDLNQSFGRWLKEERLKTAHQIITDPKFNGSLANVAYQTGFCDQSHFSRTFKQQYGVSPKMLIKRHQKVSHP